MKNERGHIIVTGTGASATTFLMQVLTDMGLDTGFQPGDDPMEWHELLSDQTPKIVKRPHFCKDLEAWLDRGFVVDHAIIPIRNLKDAADSRR